MGVSETIINEVGKWFHLSVRKDISQRKNGAYGQRNLERFKQGRIYKKGMEMTLSLNTKAMEKGEGKTAMMRKYN